VRGGAAGPRDQQHHAEWGAAGGSSQFSGACWTCLNTEHAPMRGVERASQPWGGRVARGGRVAQGGRTCVGMGGVGSPLCASVPVCARVHRGEGLGLELGGYTSEAEEATQRETGRVHAVAKRPLTLDVPPACDARSHDLCSETHLNAVADELQGGLAIGAVDKLGMPAHVAHVAIHIDEGLARAGYARPPCPAIHVREPHAGGSCTAVGSNELAQLEVGVVPTRERLPVRDAHAQPSRIHHLHCGRWGEAGCAVPTQRHSAADEVGQRIDDSGANRHTTYRKKGPWASHGELHLHAVPSKDLPCNAHVFLADQGVKRQPRRDWDHHAQAVTRCRYRGGKLGGHRRQRGSTGCRKRGQCFHVLLRNDACRVGGHIEDQRRTGIMLGGELLHDAGCVEVRRAGVPEPVVARIQDAETARMT